MFNILKKMAPHHIWGAAVLYIVVTWSLVYLIDVRNVWGLREGLLNAGLSYPVWWILFKEYGPTEWLQWFALGTLTFLCFQTYYRLKKNAASRGAVTFWLLLGITAGIMFLEDCGNTRHHLARMAINLSEYGWSDQGGRHLRTIVELVYYIILASLPVAALLRYGRHVWKSLRFPWFLILGYALYGLAGFASGTRYINEWYFVAGGYIHQFMSSMASGSLVHASTGTLPMEFWLMDFLVEESLEVLGAYALLAGVRLKLIKKRRCENGRDG